MMLEAYIETIHDLQAERDAATAERARYGDMMTARLGQCENERDAARAEAAELRKTLRAALDILKSGRSTGRKAIQALYAAEDVLMLALGK